MLNGNDVSNPKHLKVDIFPKESHRFEMYEDDGITLKYKDGDCVKTEFVWEWSDKPIFTIKAPVGNTDLIPNSRDYTLCFRKISDCNNIKIILNNENIPFEKTYQNENLTIDIRNISGEIKVEFKEEVSSLNNNYKKELDELLMKLQMCNGEKWHLSQIAHREDNPTILLNELTAEKYDINIRNAITEIVIAQG